MKALIISLSFFTFLNSTLSEENHYPKSISMFNKKYFLIGSGLLEYSFFKIDIYEIAYYKTKSGHSSFLKLIYKRDIKKNVSNQGWEEGLKNNLKEKVSIHAKEILWIKQQTPDLKENDQLIILVDGEKGFIILNNKIKSQTDDKKISRLLHLPWIGPYPVDEDLKQDLLGHPISFFN